MRRCVVILESKADAQRAQKYLHEAYKDDKHLWQVEISPVIKRELVMNRLYWGLLHQFSGYTGHSSGELHRICAIELLGVVPDIDADLWIPWSTKELASPDFKQYVTQVQDLAYRVGTPLIEDYSF